ncbi:Receptor-Interacting Serine/Threonine-Protein Kinase 3 [Manis pentadactyla]|nr:Receptor-Interacting Serine/Threonine-Protein Kinase 3 [Manis pentadactyla]
MTRTNMCSKYSQSNVSPNIHFSDENIGVQIDKVICPKPHRHYGRALHSCTDGQAKDSATEQQTRLPIRMLQGLRHLPEFGNQINNTDPQSLKIK